MSNVNTYEAMFLLGPSAAADATAQITLCRKMIETHGGEILVAKRWDERKLTYEVGGQKRGTYIITFFKCSGEAVASIERDVKLSEEVLRVLVLRADHLNADEMAAVEPQPIIPREEKPDRWMVPSFDRPERPERSDRGPRHRRDEGEIAEAGFKS